MGADEGESPQLHTAASQISQLCKGSGDEQGAFETAAEVERYGEQKEQFHKDADYNARENRVKGKLIPHLFG